MHAGTLFTMVVSLAATAVAAEKFQFERPLMGTRFMVICYAEDRAVAEKAAAAAFSIAKEQNTIVSDYIPVSELSLLSSKPVGTSSHLSPQLFELLNHSRKIAQATGGAFDPTFGPLTKLWRETRDRGRLPAREELRAARAAIGWQYFTLDPDVRTITLHRKNMAFDLGGIAKGYTADLMLESLAAAGIPQALIAAGGDIRFGDPPPGHDGWRLALQTFDPARPDEILTLSNAAVSTSGDLYQSVEIEGVAYSHILDPGTGLGLTRRIAASVIADEAKLSDPLATAACVLGADACGALRQLPGIRDIKIRTPKECPDPISKPIPRRK